MTKIIAVGWFLIANHLTAVFNYANLRCGYYKDKMFINYGDLEI